jgi:hypothetical protein
MDNPENFVPFLAQAKDFSVLQRFRLTLGPALPHTQWILEVVSPRLKLSKRGTNNSRPFKAEDRNDWSYASTTTYVFRAYTQTTLAL